MASEAGLRAEIAEAGRRLYAKGLVAGADGNISVRLADGRILATPSGKSKGFLSPEDMVVTDGEGNPVSGGKPSSELGLHVAIYKIRPDANAVVHAHPPAATGYAAAGLPLDKPILAEALASLGAVKLAPYSPPGSAGVAEGTAPLLSESDAALLANHGAVTCGATLEQALFKMETLEHYAVISLVTEILGRQSALSSAEASALREGCPFAAKAKPAHNEAELRDVVEIIIRQILSKK